MGDAWWMLEGFLGGAWDKYQLNIKYLMLGSRCFSRLEAAELEAEPLEADTLDLVRAGEPMLVSWVEADLCACVVMTWSTPG